MRTFTNTVEDLARELDVAYGLIGDMMPIVLMALSSGIKIPFDQQFYFWTWIHTLEEKYIDVMDADGFQPADLAERRDQLDRIHTGAPPKTMEERMSEFAPPSRTRRKTESDIQ